jgi:hypothetical protein
VTDGSPPDPVPGAKRAALDAEQAHLDAVYDRVEELRRRAEARRVAANREAGGSTFQAVFERDVTAHHHAARVARLTFGDVESLAFGRLDLVDGEALHVGRLSVIDELGDVVLVDWRAPAAAAFYRATQAHPLGVARRRTLTTRGRRVDDLDDEILDGDAADRLGIGAVTGQGALLAALSRTRTGHLRDIVATIQADQDRIIRAPATGTLVVAGGPGTGKTVVALHRVAYLLYEDRERFEGRGILVVGPSRAFTEHTARVLPALGEDRAVQRPLAGLAPAGADVAGWDDPEVAEIKGDLALVPVCRRLVRAAVPPLPPQTRVSFEGTTVLVDGRTLTKVRRRLLDRVRPGEGSSYHARTAAADDVLRAALWKAWRSSHRSAGGSPPEERRGTGFDQVLDDTPQITMLRRCWWPALDPVEVAGRLASGRIDLADVAHDVLDPGRIATLRAAWTSAERWTVDDVGLLDEIAALIGPRPSTSGEDAARDDDPGIRLTSDRLRYEVEVADVSGPGYRDFAHVVVDEAQDLSPMQWRAVARRGPYASWTVVGDLAQRSRVAEPATWSAIAELIGRREVSVTRLSVNYRTPSEIVDVARSVLEAAGHDPDAVPISVRSAGERPRLLRGVDLPRRAAEVVAALTADREGTVAVIAPDARLADVASAVAALLPADDEGRTDRVHVHDPRTVKGLEFDDVIVVAPDEIATGSSVGLHHLYVAVTRSTRSLTVIASPDAEVPGADHLDADGPT